MSAIAGVWNFDEKPDAAARCARMLAALEPYGPDAVAQWSEGPVALGRSLFCLVPEDAHDRQPLIGCGGHTVLVADLRLDNRDELTASLAIPPDRARLLCDAAILLAACERWQDSVVDRLVGDYAFTLWDKSQRRLTLARDFLGQRPLHYHRGKDFFAFASMPKGLHALAEIPYAPDEDRVAEFLTLLPESGTQSFFKGVERVEPGHIVTVTPSGVASRRYWEPRRRTIRLGSADDYVEAARHHLDQATRQRLRGVNGQVGAHLSSGFDSSSVAATAARLLALCGGKVVAFTAVPRQGYDRPGWQGRPGDEGPLAAATAAMHPNMHHVLIRPGDRTPLDDLDRIFLFFGGPVFNLCNMVWASAINEAARERKLDILLTGHMGNLGLSYSGYEWLPELLRKGRLMSLTRQVKALVANKQGRWRGNLARVVGPFVPAWFWHWAQVKFGGTDWDIGVYSAIRPDRMAEIGHAARAHERSQDLSFRPWSDGFAFRVWVLRTFDLGNYNKGTLAGWGIDQRDPTADRRLIEFCLSLPMEQFLANGEPRALAKRAFADRLPQAVLQQRSRGYQAVDWHERLTAARGSVAEEIDRLESCGPAARALDLPRLRKLTENWPTDGWERDAVMHPYRLALLRGISAGHFLRKATGGNR
jgi:asparagine synthase (glutamine-hydrolysing)